MDTIYYNVSTRRVKVSGGPDLLTFVPTVVPAPAPQNRAAGGEVLDFARCRQRLETKEAWKQLNQTAQDAPEVRQACEEEALPALTRRERAANWLELSTSAAVIAVSLAAVTAFLRF
ncbi:MAG: hypothetical protein HFF05_04420 [Oscillospiraceae bacterium]|nr:hypothetical protein [Oscillospiraceae bacterium]